MAAQVFLVTLKAEEMKCISLSENYFTALLLQSKPFFVRIVSSHTGSKVNFLMVKETKLWILTPIFWKCLKRHKECMKWRYSLHLTFPALFDLLIWISFSRTFLTFWKVQFDFSRTFWPFGNAWASPFQWFHTFFVL